MVSGQAASLSSDNLLENQILSFVKDLLNGKESSGGGAQHSDLTSPPGGSHATLSLRNTGLKMY